jgi:hypothetical protein
MHRINDAIVKDGKLILSNLPFADGEHVRIVVDKAIVLPAAKTASIAQIRKMLKGGVERFDNPCEPMIPTETWEMLK